MFGKRSLKVLNITSQEELFTILSYREVIYKVIHIMALLGVAIFENEFLHFAQAGPDKLSIYFHETSFLVVKAIYDNNDIQFFENWFVKITIILWIVINSFHLLFWFL